MKILIFDRIMRFAFWRYEKKNVLGFQGTWKHEVSDVVWPLLQFGDGERPILQEGVCDWTLIFWLCNL